MSKDDIIRIIETVLQRPVCEYDRFDELGADILDELFVKNQIEEKFNCLLPEDNLWQKYPVVGDFAEMVLLL